MTYTRLAIIGIIAVIIGIVGTNFFSQFADTYISQSSQLKKTVKHSGGGGSVIQMGVTSETITETVRIRLPYKISIADSGIIEFDYMALSDKHSMNELSGFIAIDASSSSFDVAPSTVISKSVYNGQTARFAWTLSPRRPGNHNIALGFTGITRKALKNMQAGIAADAEEVAVTVFALSTPGEVTTEADPIVYNIQVVDTLGIPVRVGTIISYISSFAGAALTFPWLYSIWETRRKSEIVRKGSSSKRTNQKGIRRP